MWTYKGSFYIFSLSRGWLGEAVVETALAVLTECECYISIYTLSAVNSNLNAILRKLGLAIWLYRHDLLLMIVTYMLLRSRMCLCEAPVDINAIHLSVM